MSTTRRAKPGCVKPMHRTLWAPVVACAAVSCVPPGNSEHGDAGTTSTTVTMAPAFRPSINVMRTPFEDDFERPHHDAGAHTLLLPSPSASVAGSAPHLLVPPPMTTGPESIYEAMQELGPNWRPAATNAWHIENGRLCGQGARNHGVWLNRVLPINARIEFDAISESPEGDIKAEIWGDGQSHATAISYTNATSYLTILGGWKNKFHVLARINEHAPDRRQVAVDEHSDDPRAKPVYAGQIYHFKIERSDGHTVRWAVNGLDYLSYDDPSPLIGMGHDHFGFNDWEVKVCFDNVKVTPLR
jgi:hypothetical protein